MKKEGFENNRNSPQSSKPSENKIAFLLTYVGDIGENNWRSLWWCQRASPKKSYPSGNKLAN